MPNGITAFDLNQPDLQTLLARVHRGEIQLPDFQRGWVWREEGIRSLIASVTLAYPIGALLMLKTGGRPAFHPRPIEGAPETSQVPEVLLLDGQQRITSLYQALKRGEPVQTQDEKGKNVARWFYLDIHGCMDPDRERALAIRSTPADRVVRANFNRDVVLDLSTEDAQFEHWMIPLEVAFDAERTLGWQNRHVQWLISRQEYDQIMHFQAFNEAVLKRLRGYRVPVIELAADTDHAAVCQVFENVNTGGVKLTVFELLTAMFAAEDEHFRLRADWYGVMEQDQLVTPGRMQRLHAKPVLRSIRARDFMQAVTLLASFEDVEAARSKSVGCTRRDMLKLKLAAYRRTADRVEQGFLRAASMLTRLCIYDERNLPYPTQLVPLAAILARLGASEESEAVREKLERWYWCGVFGELYGSSTETRFAHDLQDVLRWVQGAPEPTTVKDSSFDPTRLLTLRTRNSAAYKGVAALLLANGCRDLARGDAVAEISRAGEAIDIHHLFPQSWCRSNNIEPRDFNAIYNRTPLARRTNRRIAGYAPSVYLGGLERKDVTPAQLDTYCRTHLASPELMRADAYADFKVDRSRRLLDLIEDATGKLINGRESEAVRKAFGAILPRSPGSRDTPTQVVYGRYAVLEELGGGGMSRAYRAFDQQTRTQVFVKQAPAGDGVNAVALKRELSIYTRIERAGVQGTLRILEVHHDDHTMGLVTELADGGSLADFLEQRGGTLPAAEVKRIGLEIAAALSKLHALEVVHRDLKPGNVMRVGTDWKLGDFGLAKSLVRFGPSRRTLRANWTPGYAPEEQVALAEPHPSMDVYALGKVLTCLLTGQTDPDQLHWDYWRDLLLHCTKTDPTERPELPQVIERLGRIPC